MTKNTYRLIAFILLFLIIGLLFLDCFRITFWGEELVSFSLFDISKVCNSLQNEFDIDLSQYIFLIWLLIITMLAEIVGTFIEAIVKPDKNAVVNLAGFISAIVFSLIILVLILVIQNRITKETDGWITGADYISATIVPWIMLISGCAGVFLCFYGKSVLQSDENTLFSKFFDRNKMQIVQQSNADELKKFKELLDSGIITQEEFDAKKKQLLGL